MNAQLPVHNLTLAKTAAPAAAEQEEALYEIRKKIYPRAVSGWFAGWRVFFVVLTQVIFYGLAWMQWNGRQAVLFDLAARKFYILGVVFWPQDFIFLTALLVICALSLFLFTAVAGRLWCGYACPQTVYTEMFMWIEQKIEGSRLQRQRLDSLPWGVHKIAVKGAKHAVWIAIALWTGFTFVGYFTPIRALSHEVATLGLGPWETFWILFYGFATYGNAGWMREQVCKYMCPYARFQGVMFDRDTLVITYDAERGEPRGFRSRDIDYKAAGLGTCVDCGICVQVCPVGIDIRKGLQYECIGCAACIDGCDQVMDKMRYPRGLIRYTTENALENHLAWKQMVQRIFHPRVLIYTAILWSIIFAVGAALYLRQPLKVNVIRDRGTLVREVENGVLENVYRLQIMNTDEAPHGYFASASGLNAIRLITEKQPIEVPAVSSMTVPVRVQAAPGEIKPGAYPIQFHVQSSEDKSVAVSEKSIFLIR
ncbi:MAG TPA: cytochrome c oxidase accessory protein CcoG [Burkholderiales bacterium]|nr:cytochrome c oxidase accessory protein CcoG [Burkholderiales bacterium]